MICFNKNIFVGKFKPKEREQLWKNITSEELTHFWNNDLKIQGFEYKQFNRNDFIEVDNLIFNCKRRNE